jgi:hypothetical protein
MKKWVFFVAPPAIVLLVAICGEVVMHLWNWLAPTLFGWHQISFWQALGLLILCRILFGSWSGRGGDSGRSRSRRVTAEVWERMTPEERGTFRQRKGWRCGGFSPPTSETGEPA